MSIHNLQHPLQRVLEVLFCIELRHSHSDIAGKQCLRRQCEKSIVCDEERFTFPEECCLQPLLYLPKGVPSGFIVSDGGEEKQRRKIQSKLLQNLQLISNLPQSSPAKNSRENLASVNFMTRRRVS